jgi:hypothetical protein
MIFMLSSLASAAMFDTAPFQCPQCDAVYQVVRVEAEAACDRDINCPVCHAPLRSRDGHFIFKYFLMGQPKRSHAAYTASARVNDALLSRGLSTASPKTVPLPP